MLNIDMEKERLGKLIKGAILGLSIALLLGCGILYGPKAVQTFQPAKEEKKVPITSVQCDEKKVALSFDVSGKNEDIQDILEVLRVHSIQGSFFLTGDWVSKYPDDVKNMYADGHDIGNQSEHHTNMSQMTKNDCIKEIGMPHNRVKELTGERMKLFRAPYGEYSEQLLDTIEQVGYYPIQWSIDSEDWKDYGADTIVNQVCNSPNLDNGAIILFHNGTKFTKEALGEVIRNLQHKGYQIVKISELIYEKDYVIDEHGKQCRK